MSDKIKFTYKDNRLTIGDGDLVKAFEISDTEDPVLKYVLRAIDQLDNDPEHRVVTEVVKSCYFQDQSPEDRVISGTYIPLVEGDTYNITYEGTTYNNIAVAKTTELYCDGSSEEILYLGNYSSSRVRSINIGQSLDSNYRNTLIEGTLPFCISVPVGNNINSVPVIWSLYNGDIKADIEVISSSNPSNSYTLDVSTQIASYFPPKNFQTAVQEFGAGADRVVIITFNGTQANATWEHYSDEPGESYYLDVPGVMVDISNYTEEGYHYDYIEVAGDPSNPSIEPLEITFDTIIS